MMCLFSITDWKVWLYSEKCLIQEALEVFWAAISISVWNTALQSFLKIAPVISILC